MSQNLEEAGFAVIAFGQGFKDMNPPSKELMRRQPRPRRPPRTGMDGRRHPCPNRPGRQHQTRQARVHREGWRSRRTIMALDRAIRNGSAPGSGRVYDERGLLVF